MDSSIVEIGNLLNEVESLLMASTNSATLSAAEIAANQAQVDDALTAIDRIVSTTNFAGKKLLDGSFGVETAGVSTNSNVDNLRVYSRSQTTSDQVLTVTRTTSAALATGTLANLTGAAASRTSGTTEVVITGSLGAATVTLASGLTQAEVVTQINLATAQTGVSAIQTAANVGLNSTTFGTDAFVSVQVLSGGEVNSTYGTATSDGSSANNIAAVAKTAGTDASVTINGQTAAADGLDVVYNANGMSLSFSLGQAFGEGNTAADSTSFTVKASGGATFQLGTTSNTRSTIGVDSLASYNLAGGNGTARMSEMKSGGSIDLRTNVAGALNSVREAISDVASIRGRIGGFQKYQVGSAISSLQAAETGLTEATSVIMDTDFAVATAKLNREQVLIQSSISLLGVANQQSSQILALL
jgi:flagellin